MKYDIFIQSYLKSSGEPVGKFAERAGVHRSSVYRAMDGLPIMFPLVKSMVEAAGGSLEIIELPAPPATSPAPAQAQAAAQ